MRPLIKAALFFPSPKADRDAFSAVFSGAGISWKPRQLIGLKYTTGKEKKATTFFVKNEKEEE